MYIFSICNIREFAVFVFFFKQKTAYEMRISDWSSDVCSSDLGTEQVNDDVAGIDQHPIGVGQAFDANLTPRFLLDPLRQLLGDRRDVARRAAAREQHMVGDAAFAGTRDGIVFLGLVPFTLMHSRRGCVLYQIVQYGKEGCGAGKDG